MPTIIKQLLQILVVSAHYTTSPSLTPLSILSVDLLVFLSVFPLKWLMEKCKSFINKMYAACSGNIS